MTMMVSEQDKAEEAGRDWSQLPWDLLKEIAQRLIILKEKIRIRVVCKTWRKGLAQQLPMMFRQSSPFLMLPYCSMNNNAGAGCVSQECRLLLDVAHSQFHHISFGKGLKEAICRGSAFGWLFMVQRVPVLFNPLTGNQISLPPITTFPHLLDYFPERVGEEYLFETSYGSIIPAGKGYVEAHVFERFAMSAEPTAEDCVVMANCVCWGRCCLAFCKPGDDKWTLIPDLLGVGLANIVFCRNNFYVLDCFGKVLICDLAIPKLSFLVTEAEILSINSYLLVGPDDELMLLSRVTGDERDLAEIYGEEVLDSREGEGKEQGEGEGEKEEDGDGDGHEEGGVRLDNGFPMPEEDAGDDEEDAAAGVLYIRDSEELLRTPFMYSTLDFSVFKLNKDTNQWDQVETIGDHALFIGFNAPACLSTKDHPRLKSNCIYFTDDYASAHLRDRHGGYDMGIYHLSDGSIEPFCCNNSYKPFLVWPPPVWVSSSIY